MGSHLVMLPSDQVLIAYVDGSGDKRLGTQWSSSTSALGYVDPHCADETSF
jgi:hypothetical protein